MSSADTDRVSPELPAKPSREPAAHPHPQAERATEQFGHERVTHAEKTRRVTGVFESVATRYDVMNDLMSLGTHRLMKRTALEMSGVGPGDRVLDLAGGTGDMAALLADAVHPDGQVVLADINAAMLDVGRDRLFDQGHPEVVFSRNSAEALPFADASFDCATITFGLRNFTDKLRALEELVRVLRPGGVLLVLEFSHPQNPALKTAYQAFQALWPPLGRLVANDDASYRYLVDSIAVHPNQEALKLLLTDAGFGDVEYHNLAGGIAAIHRAVR